MTKSVEVLSMYNGEGLNAASNPKIVIMFEQKTISFIAGAAATNSAFIADMGVNV